MLKRSISTQIKHVIYLMLENRSFDNIAGYWDFNPDIDNLVHRGTPFCNDYTNPNWTVWGEPVQVCASPIENEVPLADPDHDFAGTSYEIYQNWYPTNNDIPTMGGFVDRESQVLAATGTPGDAAFVIKAFSEKKTAFLAELAGNFTFWDSYVCIYLLIPLLLFIC